MDSPNDPSERKPRGGIDSLDEIDKILDYFSKAHPFADTRAYNIYHDKAKARIIALITNARIEEQEYHLNKLKTGKWISYGTEVTNRLKQLEAGDSTVGEAGASLPKDDIRPTSPSDTESTASTQLKGGK